MVEDDETLTCNVRTRTTSNSEPCLSQRQSADNIIIASVVSGAGDQGKVLIKRHYFYNNYQSLNSKEKRRE